ncbi:uncharacterized protein [Nicotiana sylvestris]|uniref:uncharacterized protein n=1 Tax=Nicotiana sylvestris TaxID=4096 RepID=UPI00388C379A
MENNAANVVVDATTPAAPTVSVVVFGGDNFNRKHAVIDKGKEIATRSSLVEENNCKRKSSNMYDKRNGYKPKTNNQTLKEKCNCFVCDTLGHYVAQCRKRVGNDNPTKAKVLDSGAARHICAKFVSYTQVDEGEEVVYLGDSRTTQVLGKGKVLLKLTSGKTLALNDMLHIPSIRANLVSVGLLGKVGVKVSFESDKVVLTKNNNFVGKGYYNHGMFVLNVINGNDNTSTYLIDSFNLWRRGEAILSACHLQNRILYKKTGKTPYELWKGTAYRFLVVKGDVLENNTIVETKNAEFFENIFPLKFEKISNAPIIPSDNISNVSIIKNDFGSEDLRRSKRSRKEKSFDNDFYTYLVDNDPLTYSEAISSYDASFWKEAIDVELDSILQNKTWILVDLPPGAKPIGCKWIFKKKPNPDGFIDKYKARLVAKGFTQKQNIDYFDTYAPISDSDETKFTSGYVFTLDGGVVA